MQVKSFDPDRLWTDYAVTNRASGRTYRVALRGWERGESFCTCPDFRKNTLGTCKHILHVIDKMKTRFNKAVRETSFKIEDISLYLRYGQALELRLLIPEDLEKEAMSILKPLKNRPVKDVKGLLKRIRAVERLGPGDYRLARCRGIYQHAPVSGPGLRKNGSHTEGPNPSPPEKNAPQGRTPGAA